MEWKVLIEGKPNLRIMVKFLPLTEQIAFIGQFKRTNLEWVNFCIEEHTMYIDLDQINEMLVKTYDTMTTRINMYNEVAEGFTLIKVIEVKED